MTTNKTSNQIRSYAELRKEIREALRRQHPEWIDANGKSPLCDSYEAGLGELLALITLRKRRQSLRTHNEERLEERLDDDCSASVEIGQSKQVLSWLSDLGKPCVRT